MGNYELTAYLLNLNFYFTVVESNKNNTMRFKQKRHFILAQ